MILSFIKGSTIFNPLPVKETAQAAAVKEIDSIPALPEPQKYDSVNQKLTLEETFDMIYNKHKEQLETQRFERELIAGSKKSYG